MLSMRPRAFIVAVMVLSAPACNQRTDVPGLNSIPTAPSSVSAPPPAPSVIFSLNFKPAAVYAGAGSTGTAVLSVPAPAGGAVVALSAGDPAVTVPSLVSIPAGSDTATFNVSTQLITADRDVNVSASFGGRSVSRTLPVWTVLPTFFSFISDAADPIGRGGVKRLTPQSARFTAWCNASQVTVSLDSSTDFWTATFAAPAGTRLAPGTYENAPSASIAPSFPNTSGPEMSISGNGVGCSSVGRFVVHEADIATNGRVNRFWASFEQRCNGRTDALQGDVRVVAPSPVSTFLICR